MCDFEDCGVEQPLLLTHKMAAVLAAAAALPEEDLFGDVETGSPEWKAFAAAELTRRHGP